MPQEAQGWLQIWVYKKARGKNLHSWTTVFSSERASKHKLWKSETISVRLQRRHWYVVSVISGSQTSGPTPRYTSIRHALWQFWCMGAWLGLPQSTCALVLMHLTRGNYARSWGYCILATCQMWKSEEPLVLHRFLSSSREDHHRALAAAIWQVPPDWKRPVGRPSHTWLCAMRQTLALWTLAAWLPG